MLNKEKMAAAFTGVKTVFDNVLKTFTPDWKSWATTLPSDTETEDYHWVDLLIVIRQFFGEKIIGKMRAQKWSVKNIEWYAAWAEKTKNINNDKLGLLGMKTNDALVAALNDPQFQLEDEIYIGFSKACFDDQYFYDTDHPSLADDGTTVSNLRTLPFSYDNVRKMWNEHLSRCKNAQGQRMLLEPDSIFVGNKWKSLAEDFFNNEKKPGGGDNDMNALKGKFAVRYCPKFDEADSNGAYPYEDYFVMTFKIPGSSLRFAAWQDRLQPELTCTAMQAVNDFGAQGVDAIQWEHKEVRWSVDFEGAATLTLWMLAVGSTGSGAAE